jgi:hypothetical protein
MLFQLCVLLWKFFLRWGQMAWKNLLLFYHPVVLLHINQYHVSRTEHIFNYSYVFRLVQIGREVTVHTENTYLRLNLSSHSTAQQAVQCKMAVWQQCPRYAAATEFSSVFRMADTSSHSIEERLVAKCVGAWETAHGTNHVPSGWLLSGNGSTTNSDTAGMGKTSFRSGKC